MRRVNLIVTSELKDFIVVDAILNSSGVVARGAAKAINRGVDALLSCDSTAEPDTAISIATENYSLLKLGKSPRIVVYIDEIDKQKLKSVETTYSLHPKSRGYRILLAIGISKMIDEVSEVEKRHPILGSTLRRISFHL